MNININIVYSADGETVSLSIDDWQKILMILQMYTELDDHSKKPSKKDGKGESHD